MHRLCDQDRSAARRDAGGTAQCHELPLGRNEFGRQRLTRQHALRLRVQLQRGAMEAHATAELAWPGIDLFHQFGHCQAAVSHDPTGTADNGFD
jgi:hypothetical protein